MHLYTIISKNNFVFLNDTVQHNAIYTIQHFKNNKSWFEYALYDEKDANTSDELRTVTKAVRHCC